MQSLTGLIPCSADVLFEGDYLEAVKGFIGDYQVQANLSNQVFELQDFDFKETDLYSSNTEACQGIMISELYNIDCMEGMKSYPDKYFDLAIVDPPYGIGEADGRCRTRKKHNNIVKHEAKEWDNERPTSEYWKELKRVSKNQIVFGANYFTEYLQPSMGWIFCRCV